MWLWLAPMAMPSAMPEATSQIGRVLGYSNGDEVIHRDDLVLLADAP